MKRFLSAMDTVTDWGGKGVAFLVLAIIGVVAYEVIARYVFNSPTVWAHEMTWLLHGNYAALAGAYVLLERQHVRMDVLWSRLSLRGQAIADLATSGLGFIFVGALLWFSIPYAWHSFQMREILYTVWSPPIYPSKMILVIATFWLLVQMIVKFMRDIYIVTGRVKVKD